MKISVHPEAELDILEAASFYERQGTPVLAARFSREFRRIAELLVERPGLGAPRAHGLRGMSMAVFPYTVIYDVLIDEIRILVVKHDRRAPTYGSDRS